MKKIVTLLSILTLAFIISTSFTIIAATPDETETTPLGTCTNHNFGTPVYYRNGEHKYSCTNANCSAYMLETCSFYEFCGYYSFNNTMPCTDCGHGSFEIHNRVPTYDLYYDGYYHYMKCQNFDEYSGSCDSFEIDDEYMPIPYSCTLGPTMIWRGFEANRGHILTRTCNECNHTYDVGNHYPEGHPNYFSVNNDCGYCKLDDPYFTEFDPNEIAH